VRPNTIHCGDALEWLKTLPDECVQCCVTSPPYWGLRDYGVKGQLGLEKTPEEYVETMTEVFREVRRVLRKDGVCFINLGDSYFGSGKGLYRDGRSHGTEGKKQRTNAGSIGVRHGPSCDISDTIPQDCPLHDSIWNHPCDGCQAASVLHSLHKDRSVASAPSGDSRAPSQAHTESAHDHLPKSRSSGQKPTRQSFSAKQDQQHIQAPSREQHPASQLSRPDESSQRHREASHQSDNSFSSPPLPASCTRDAPQSEHMISVPGVSPKDVLSMSGQHANRLDSIATAGAFAAHTSGMALSSCPYRHFTIPFHHCQLKPKDLVGIPWRLAFALQADGWWLRSDIIWHKPNPMPESVTDRPTKSHEYIFLMSKAAKYYYDAEAIKESQITPLDTKAHQTFGAPGGKAEKVYGAKVSGNKWEPSGSRNKRDVWTIATHPFKEAHYATFPPKLIEPCIKTGTSERGCCQRCGAPHTRIVEKGNLVPDNPGYKPRGNKRGGSFVKNAMTPAGSSQGHPNFHYEQTTVGWQQSCKCDDGKPQPCIILDPFMGSGTTAMVAQGLGRDFIGCELNPNNVKMAKRRIFGPLYAGAIS